MNEERFLRKLNSDIYNPDGYCTCMIVEELIQLGRNSFMPIQNSILKSILRFYSFKSLEKIIRDNLETILEKTPNEYKENVLRILIREPNLNQVIKDKFDVVIDFLKDANGALKIKAAKLFKKIEGFKEFIEDSIEQILSGTKDEELFNVVQLIKGVSPKVENKLNAILEKKQLTIVRTILDKSTNARRTELSDREQCLDDYVTTLSIMIRELLASEGKKWTDINYKGEGGYSIVYEIGGKVIKIGAPRRTYNIPNHRRILQPLIRTNFTSGKAEDKVFACIEISDKVEAKQDKDYKDEYEDKLYQVYKELREDGIIWTDARLGNIGILKKENIPSLNGEKMWVAPNSTGFDKENSGEPLKEGEWVIIDTDYIFSKDDSEIIWTCNSFSKRFEARWQREQQTKIANNHQPNRSLGSSLGENIK